MRNNKGFTLIELLAVILVLAIIAIIAIPIILNVVEQSEIGAFRDSVYGVASAAELYLTENELNEILSQGGMNVEQEFDSRGCKNGGGATDIRLVSGVWNDITSLRSRIMVAASGGGTCPDLVGAPAGGLYAENGKIAGNKTNGCDFVSRAAGGATQTSGGLAGQSKPGNSYYCVYVNTPWTAKSGTFGIGGGRGATATDGATFDYSGGGYGWSNVKGALKQMPKPAGGDYASGTGHSGSGYARITFISDN